jgi:hypothetical protein
MGARLVRNLLGLLGFSLTYSQRWAQEPRAAVWQGGGEYVVTVDTGKGDPNASSGSPGA